MKKFFKFFNDNFYVMQSLFFWLMAFVHYGEVNFWYFAGFAITFIGLHELIKNVRNKS